MEESVVERVNITILSNAAISGRLFVAPPAAVHGLVKTEFVCRHLRAVRLLGSQATFVIRLPIVLINQALELSASKVVVFMIKIYLNFMRNLPI
jgi:hypothetical protein